MVEMGLRLLLGGVLGGAALAKLLRPGAGQEAMAGLGFSTPGMRVFAFWSLIGIELALAIAVVAGLAGADLLGAALMLTFALAMTGAIANGRGGEPCGCFGAQSRIGWTGVARNLVLAAGFGVAAALPSDELSTDQWLGLGLVAALAGSAALGAAVLALARELGLLRMRVGSASALEIPSEGPELGVRTDMARRIPAKAGSELALAVFTSAGCHICASLEPAVESIARHPAVSVAHFDEHRDADVWRGLDVPGSPYGIALGLDGTVLAKGTFNNLAQLESILGAGERRRAQAGNLAHG